MNETLRVRVTGPLEGHAAGFVDELAGVGYTPRSAALLMGLMAHVSRWLAAEGLGPEALSADEVERFVAARRAAGYRTYLSPAALAPLLGFLRARGVLAAAEEPVLDAAPALLARYRRYLIQERGLTAETARSYLLHVRPFVVSRVDQDGRLDLAGLTPGDVLEFVLEDSRRGARTSTKKTVTALRSLLGFLHVEGLLGRPLAGVVPAAAAWRLTGLPRGLDREQTRLLLAGCDRLTAAGRRDRAILLMLVRLGMRSGEVVALALDDIDWRCGEILVRGKGNRVERLPLPHDVGEALADYLRDGRPATAADRAVFVRVRAPHHAMSSTNVSQIVRAAARRVGLPPLGAHRLRHTTACELLRAGASLVEIGQLLRQRSARSTAIYAKVDEDRLRELARSWPGGAP